MTPGEIVSRGHDIFVVLAADSARLAVAPLVLGARSRETNAVAVRASALGDGCVLCGSARLDSGAWSVTGFSLSPTDLLACQNAAKHAQQTVDVERRWSSLSGAFEQALPRIPRSGGRRVGAMRVV